MTTPPPLLADSLRGIVSQWNVGMFAAQTLWTRSLGAAAVAAAGRQRLETIVRHARMHSPFYRKRWRHLPPGVPALADLPVVTRDQLMAAFDDWCTDRAIAWRDVERFVAERAHVGEPFRDRYLVWTSSGTSGRPGVYVQDEAALAAYDALVSIQTTSPTFAGCDWGAALAQGGRAALVAADGGHFASIASWRRVAQGKPWLDTRSFAVTLPLAQIVAGLNAYRPAFVAAYPTVLSLLADEQAAGRLALRPAALWSGGEVLSPVVRAAIEDTFGCPLINEYGASECLTIGYGCHAGWIHVNADWVILEPVDRRYRPTPPGELSDTVLLTNLANAVQPIVRYDLGDRVRTAPGPCACGSPLPAVQVEGRCDDVVAFAAPGGGTVRLVPLALTTVVEESAALHRLQIVQDAPDALALRLPAGERERAGGRALAALRAYLAQQGLANVTVRLDMREPQPDPRDGKLRQVIARHA